MRCLWALIAIVFLWTIWQMSFRKLRLSDGVKIGPLEWQATNPSVLTYNDIGYMGRSGNQLFELAATVALAKRARCHLLFPPSVRRLKLWRWFDLEGWPISDRELKPDAYLDEQSNLDALSVPATGRLYSLAGYRQSYLYFEDIREQLAELFPLRENISRPMRENYIALHVRRTDYVATGPKKDLGLQLECQLPYYVRAIELLRDRYGPLPVFAATDDRDWVQRHMPGLGTTSASSDPLDDFLLVREADHCIVANSTFSYWAALLNPRKKSVIAPSRWWHDRGLPNRLFGCAGQAICPPEWILLDPETGERAAHPLPDGGRNGWLRSAFSSNLLRKFTP